MCFDNRSGKCVLILTVKCIVLKYVNLKDINRQFVINMIRKDYFANGTKKICRALQILGDLNTDEIFVCSNYYFRLRI